MADCRAVFAANGEQTKWYFNVSRVLVLSRSALCYNSTQLRDRLRTLRIFSARRGSKSLNTLFKRGRSPIKVQGNRENKTVAACSKVIFMSASALFHVVGHTLRADL